MRMVIFVKDNKICYTVTQNKTSENLDRLEALGWQHAGIISGRDMSGNFPTMTEILQEAVK